MLLREIKNIGIFTSICISCSSEMHDMRNVVNSSSDFNTQDTDRIETCNKMHITNGKIIQEGEFKPVVKIRVTNRRTILNCTGTFVGPRTVLTAAHCLINSPTKLEVFYKGRTHIVDNFQEHPLWKAEEEKKINNDIALLKFEDDISSDTYQICNFQPETQMNGVIVGMGLTHATEMQNWDKKVRKGYIEIDRINESNGTITNLGQVNTTTADGTNAGTSAGDSGGPLLITQADNNYCIIAITRSGYVSKLSNENISIYENLKYEKNLDFVKAFEMIEKEAEEYLKQEKESNDDDAC